MMEQAQPARKIDYIKFVWTGGYDLFQTHTLRQLDALADAAERRGINSLTLKFTVLGGNKMRNEERRVIEIWGEFAHFVFHACPTAWLNKVYRLDYRETIPALNSSHVQALQTALTLGAKPKVNTMVYNTRDRQKSASRDVGGQGITFGSRKSDHHAVLYARANEPVCLEYRMQGKKVNRMLRDAYTLWQDERVYDVRAHILTEVEAARAKFLSRAISVDTLSDIVTLAEQALRRVENISREAAWSESYEEREYWQSLTEEEQRMYQQAVWFPIKPA